MLVLERMGLTPADLLAAPAARPTAPTFAEYIPVVSALVSDGCRRAYGSYWNRVVEQWGDRRIDEPTPSEIRWLVQHIRASVVPRRNSRGGRSAAEHLIAALRCLYKHAEEDCRPQRPSSGPTRVPHWRPAATPRCRRRGGVRRTAGYRGPRRACRRRARERSGPPLAGSSRAASRWRRRWRAGTCPRFPRTRRHSPRKGWNSRRCRPS